MGLKDWLMCKGHGPLMFYLIFVNQRFNEVTGLRKQELQLTFVK